MNLIQTAEAANINYRCEENPGGIRLFDVNVHLPGLTEAQQLDRAVIQRENLALIPDNLPPWLRGATFQESFSIAWKTAVISERWLEQDPIPNPIDQYPYYFRLNAYWVALRQLRLLIQDRIRTNDIRIDPAININMTYKGSVLNYSTDLPISSSLYDLGCNTVKYIVPYSVNYQPTNISSVLFVLSLNRGHADVNNWRTLCENLANALNLTQRRILTIDNLDNSNNAYENCELICCCGPDLLPDERGDFYNALTVLVRKTQPRIILLLMPKTTCAVNVRDVFYPLGYAQRLVQVGVPHCFALSRYVPVQGRQCLLDRLAQHLQLIGSPPAITDEDLVRIVCDAIIACTNTYPRGTLGFGVMDDIIRIGVRDGTIMACEYTEIAAMSTVLVSSIRGWARPVALAGAPPPR